MAGSPQVEMAELNEKQHDQGDHHHQHHHPPPSQRPDTQPRSEHPGLEGQADPYDRHEDDHAAHDQALSPTSLRNVDRLHDDLELLRAERLVSNEIQQEMSNEKSARRGEPEPDDPFNMVETKAQREQLPPQPNEKQPTLKRLWLWLRKVPRAFRYILYSIPIAIILLVPILLDIYAYDGYTVPIGGKGGVVLLWFGVWLEVVWCTLWASRIATSLMPHIFYGVAHGIGSTNSKKWKDIGRQLEFHTAMFIWMLAVLISFLPIVNSHRDWPGNDVPEMKWINILQRIFIALFVLAVLNFVEKILIQWIATSFHLRTYAYRILQNKREISFLITLYEYARSKLETEDPLDPDAGSGSGSKTPLGMLQNNARQAWNTVGNVANRMAGDFTGRKYLGENHPRKVVAELLRSTSTAHTLARLIHRVLVKPGEENITPDDMKPAFPNDEDGEACFGVFDKDLNGDLSMEELEIATNEIHLEKKAIAASLKDLDSVIQKLDRVFFFLIVVITIIVFVSIISGSAAAALTSAGTTILGLAWMLQATAQEFLQSIIFVFVKHPFDVGDRVTVYGATGIGLTGDDYYVQEISLLYTEFKKMQGHIVQAPNSVLNNLFILNQRRSSGLADVIELKIRFGTPQVLIDELKARMTDFVQNNKRDYGQNIITELSSITEVWSVTVNFVFFHKSNYQNELLRLTRHNRFTTELMHQMHELGIEGPRKYEPGGAPNFPLYLSNMGPPSYSENPTEAAPAGPAPSLRSPSSMNFRRRSNSRTTSAAQEAMGMDFQDVYGSRKADVSRNIARLNTIRRESQQVSRSSQEGDRLAPMNRVTSTSRASHQSGDSNHPERRGLFGRMRNDSKTTQQSQSNASNIV